MNAERARQHQAHLERLARMKAIPRPKPIFRPKAVKVYEKPIGPRRPALVIKIDFDQIPKTSSAVILDEVCEKHRITLWQLKSKTRSGPVVKARQEAYYRLYDECPHLSLPMVGRILGGRDHTSCLHGLKRHAERNNLPLPRLRFLEAAE